VVKFYSEVVEEMWNKGDETVVNAARSNNA
jgi:hypothetical protein